MNLWEFLKAESDLRAPKLIVMAAIAGFSNALLMALVNAGARLAAETPSADEEAGQTRLFMAFAITIVLYIVSQRHLLRTANFEVESVVRRVRVRIADKIRGADLMPLEALGREQIYASINRDTQIVSQAAAPAIIAIQAGIMVFFSLLYVAYLRPMAFILTVVVVGIGLVIHFGKHAEMMADLSESAMREGQFFGYLSHMLEGFKEVKQNSARSDDLFDTLETAAESVRDLKTRSGYLFTDHYLFSQTTFYFLIATMVFILPRLAQTAFSDVVTRLTAAILFILGPLSSLVGTIPVFSQASVAVANLQRLETQLEQLQREAKDRDEENDAAPEEFHEIRLTEVRFAYRDRQGVPTFELGPLSLSIPKGELLFLVGGNGSGKSTLLKLLAGLYYPDSGKIELDGRDLADVGYTSYRNLFSVIFTDYHLFQRLFGLRHVRAELVSALLNNMQIADKTRFVKGRFINQELSTGQRKRLALIVSLLENRPICIFDEWAADQDPTFRHHFYTEILPALQQQGKTIIAATHDDRYFDVADRVLKMEAGGFTVIKSAQQ